MRGTLGTLAAASTAAAFIVLAGCQDGTQITAPEHSLLLTEEAAPPLPPAEHEAFPPRFPDTHEVPPPMPPSDAERIYHVTIENLTSGQPLSPGVFATHGQQTTLFELGMPASEGIRLIAEEGNPSVAAKELKEAGAAYDIVTTGQPIHRMRGPGSSVLTVEIRAGSGADFLSLATMLVCTNDGFTGVSGLKLPEGYEPVTYHAEAYDAGTQANTEVFEHISDTCGRIGPVPFPANGNGGIREHEKPIHKHRGINGTGDLKPTSHGWNGSIARITIRQVAEVPILPPVPATLER
jgi:hypothetical protein